MGRIIVPLVAPTVVVVGVLEFVAATRGVSTAILLSSHATQTLAVFQLKLIESGDMEAASVVGVVLLILSTGVAFVARMLGFKLGLGQRRPRVYGGCGRARRPRARRSPILPRSAWLVAVSRGNYASVGARPAARQTAA